MFFCVQIRLFRLLFGDISMNVNEFFKKHNFSQNVCADEMLAEFDRQMDLGLSAAGGSLKMIPAYIDADRAVPTNTPIIVLDAGGTNLRVAVLWFDSCGKVRMEDFKKHPMPGTGSEELDEDSFYNAFAEFLVPVCRRSANVGFCFSYPTEITPDLDGRLLHWTKQVKAPGVVGKMVGAGISRALERINGIKLSVKVLNDTVATLLAGKSAGLSRRYSGYVGFILGTGTNIAYIEDNAAVKKVPGLDPSRKMVINVESGNFDGAPASDFDKAFDASTQDPGVGLFEKMISGAYMGGVGMQMLKMAAQDGLFSKPAADAMLKLENLETKDFDNFVANPFVADGIFGNMPLTDDDRRTAMAVGEPLFVRAAGLTAVNIAAAVIRSKTGTDPLHPVCVTVDGSTYYKTRSAFFKSRVEEKLREILGSRGICFDIISVDDAPMVGSGVAGLIS